MISPHNNPGRERVPQASNVGTHSSVLEFGWECIGTDFGLQHAVVLVVEEDRDCREVQSVRRSVDGSLCGLSRCVRRRQIAEDAEERHAAIVVGDLGGIHKDNDKGRYVGRVNLSMIPLDGVGLEPGFGGCWTGVTKTV